MQTILEQIKLNWKRYLVSSLVTFGVGFIVSIYPSLEQVSAEDVNTSLVAGIALVGLRAGIKAVVEYLVSVFKKNE